MKLAAIPMDQIHYDEEFNCRGAISPLDVADLARDIEEKGLLQPISVCRLPDQPDKFRLLMGHRRYVAHKVLGKKTILATVREDDLGEVDARILNLTENLQRKQLNVLQEARAIDPLRKLGLTEDETAKRLGTSRGWVQVRFMLLKLPPEIQAEAAAGFINQTDIRRVYMSFRDAGVDEAFEIARLLKDTKLLGKKKRRKQKLKKQANAKVRTKPEMELMQDYLYTQTKRATIAQRVLAWTSGYITDDELHISMKEFCEAEGMTYRIP